MGPDHGGRLNRAVSRYGIPPAEWLDLSTGINPWPWPVPTLPPEVWHRLPEADDGLEAASGDHFPVPAGARCLPVAGSQAAIQALPRLRARSRVGVPAPGCAEHGWWWQQAGHSVERLAPETVDAALDRLDVLVWIHPNNPTGLALEPEQLLEWHARLHARGGWLVVDEAFIEATPEASLAPYVDAPGLVVLRSLGKFFGLAGVRGGWVLADAELCTALEAALGPWAVSGPARWVMGQALADEAWQARNRTRLASAAATLDADLRNAGLAAPTGTALFRYCPHPRAEGIHHALAAEGILTRLFTDPPALRFGLPPDDAARQRLCAAVRALECTSP